MAEFEDLRCKICNRTGLSTNTLKVYENILLFMLHGEIVHA